MKTTCQKKIVTLLISAACMGAAVVYADQMDDYAAYCSESGGVVEEKHIVKKDDIVFIPKNKWHKIKCVGDKMAIRLAVSRSDVAHVYKNI